MGKTYVEYVVLGAILTAPVVFSCGVRLAKRRYDARSGFCRVPWLVAGNLCLFLALLSLIVGMAECYYRFWYDTTDGLTISRVARRWSTRHFEYNSAGFRAKREYSTRPATGQERITFLGDSFAVGYGVPDIDDRLSNQVAQRSAAQRGVV